MLTWVCGNARRLLVLGLCCMAPLTFASCAKEAVSAAPEKSAQTVQQPGTQQSAQPVAQSQAPFVGQRGLSAQQREKGALTEARGIDGDWTLDFEGSRGTVHSQSESDFNDMKGMGVTVDTLNGKLTVCLQGAPAKTYDLRLLSRAGEVLTVSIDRGTATLDYSTPGVLRWEDQGDVLIFRR